MTYIKNVYLWAILLMAALASKAYGCSQIIVKQGMDYQKVFIAKNTQYVINLDIDLGGKTVRIGEGSTLIFEGGSMSNGTLIGNKTKVRADDYEIFKHGRITFRGYSINGDYKYATKSEKAIVIGGTWNNAQCGYKWTGMDKFSQDNCAGLAINNYIRLHRKGVDIPFPEGREYYVYEQIICSGYSIDFNNSVIRSIDFNKVENNTIELPSGAQSRPLKSLYGLINFNCDNAFIKNLTIDGRAGYRSEVPSLGTECLISMASNKNCQLQNIQIVNAVGCGICTYTISNCMFDNVTINSCGEHGIYTHAYDGTLKFNNCHFVNCGQNSTLYKQRGMSACVKFSGSRDKGFAALKNLKAYFTDCTFESSSKKPVATFYSDIPYAEFLRCKWKGVQGYSIVTPQLAEQIGRLVEFKFVECDSPCYRIQSVNTVRRLIRCTNVSNPFADSIELTDCEINVGYADVENKYTSMFENQYDTPVVIKRCNFNKGPNDIAIRNTIIHPRPMMFDHCAWEFNPSSAPNHRGSFYIVFSNPDGKGTALKSVEFKSCEINLDKYRLLYCSDTDIKFDKCNYISSYDTLIDGRGERPNRIRIFNMTNLKKKEVARHAVMQ